MAKVEPDNLTDDSPDWVFFCPGCKQLHGVWTSKPNIVNGKPQIWTFNGNVDKPTFSPSIHITRTRTGSSKPETICHSFVRDGKIQFLGDCRHDLKNQTIELTEAYN